MRGSRVKALKRQFKASYGRDPNKMELVPQVRTDIMGYIPSEVRRLKKAFKKAVADGQL
jgi:hypothetical protein